MVLKALVLVGSGAVAGAVAMLGALHARFGKRRLAQRVETPHPLWQPGQPQPAPFSSSAMIAVDPETTEKASMYPLMISAVVPRPIAFISSLSSDGGLNLAPYSYFNAMQHNPPTVVIGCCRSPGRGGEHKDTLLNIQETGEFVVNIISEWFIEAANYTCGEFDRGVDEMQLTGLTPLPSLKVKPPRVEESAVQMECRLQQIIETHDSSGAPTGAIVIGRVVMLHVAEGVAAKSPSGKLVVDPVKLQPMCRLGGLTYGKVLELFDLPRPSGKGVAAARGMAAAANGSAK